MTHTHTDMVYVSVYACVHGLLFTAEIPLTATAVGLVFRQHLGWVLWFVERDCIHPILFLLAQKKVVGEGLMPGIEEECPCR